MEEVPGVISDHQYYTLLHLNKIKKHPLFENLFQRSEDTIKMMEEAIKKDGMLEPLIVTKQGDEYILIDGYTRYEALKRLGETKATAIVIENIDLRKEDNLLLLKQLAISVNAIRRHLTPEQVMQALEELEELRVKMNKEFVNTIDIARNTYEKILKENYNSTIEAMDYVIAEAKKYPGFFRALQKAFNETEKLPRDTNRAYKLISLFNENIKQSISVNDVDLLSFIIYNLNVIYENREFVKQLRSVTTTEELRKVVTEIKEQLEEKKKETKKKIGQKKKKVEEESKVNKTLEKETPADEKKEDVKVINVNIKIDNHVTVPESSKSDRMSNLDLIDKEYLRKFIDEIEEEARHHEVYLYEYLLRAILPVIQKEAPEVVSNIKPIVAKNKEIKA